MYYISYGSYGLSAWQMSAPDSERSSTECSSSGDPYTGLWHRKTRTARTGIACRSGKRRCHDVVGLNDCSILLMIGKTVAFQLPGAFPSGAVM
jgi:hypothetical protein